MKGVVIGSGVDYSKMLEKELVVLAILLSCLLVLQLNTEAIVIEYRRLHNQRSLLGRQVRPRVRQTESHPPIGVA